MKLVLAGSHEHYRRFIDALRRKGKDINYYKYISNSNDMRGWDRSCQVIKLGSFKLNPDAERIYRECEARFDMSSVNFQPRGVQEGGIITYRGPAPEFISPGEIVMNEQQRADLLDSMRYSSYSVLGEWND